MPTIKTPMGPAIHIGTEAEAKQVESLLEKRHRFVISYCESKGWPTELTQLSIDQILEIRSKSGWQNPE